MQNYSWKHKKPICCVKFVTFKIDDFFYQNKYIENIASVQIIASSVSCLLLNHELAFEYGLAQNTQLKRYRHKKCL